MSIADRLIALRPGTHVRLFHTDGVKQLATSGRFVECAAGEVRVLPLTGGSEVTIDLSTIRDVSIPGRGRYRILRNVSVLRILAGGVLFAPFGYFLALLASMAGARGGTIYLVLWGWVLFGAVAGAFASGVGNPLDLAVLRSPAAGFAWLLRRIHRGLSRG